MTVYTRQELLDLSKSPLVPAKLEGMPELAEWFGEYEQPQVPAQHGRREHYADGTTGERREHHARGERGERGDRERGDRGERGDRERGERGERGDRDRNGADRADRRAAAAGNPFANFGRFGIDGGLDGIGGKTLASPAGEKGERRGLRGTGEGRDNRPVIDGRPPLDSRDSRKRVDEAGFTRVDDRRGVPRTPGEIASREAFTAKERREGRAEEAGWKSTREERERRNNRFPERGEREKSERGPNSLARTWNEPGNGRDGRGGRNEGGGSRPSWMDEEPNTASSSRSTPAWADEAAGSTDGPAFMKRGAAREEAKEGGMDSIQAFKAEMKERERRERERATGVVEERPEPSSSSSMPMPQAPPPKRSVFDEDEIFSSSKPTGGSGAPGQGQPSAADEGRARSSRFAKFFDGKAPPPPAAPAQQAPPPPQQKSVFEQFAAAPSPPAQASAKSREDQESMSRLMGMLQLSGQSSTSSPAMMSPPDSGFGAGAAQRSGGSRFAFSQPQSQPQAPVNLGSASTIPGFAQSTAARSPLPPPSHGRTLSNGNMHSGGMTSPPPSMQGGGMPTSMPFVGQSSMSPPLPRANGNGGVRQSSGEYPLPPPSSNFASPPPASMYPMMPNGQRPMPNFPYSPGPMPQYDGRSMPMLPQGGPPPPHHIPTAFAPLPEANRPGPQSYPSNQSFQGGYMSNQGGGSGGYAPPFLGGGGDQGRPPQQQQQPQYSGGNNGGGGGFGAPQSGINDLLALFNNSVR